MPGKKTEPQLAKSVMAELKKRDLKMRSHGFFVGMALLTGAALAASLIATVYLIGFTLIEIKHRAVFEYLGFGAPGFGQFLHLFPWGWLLLALASLAAAYFLLRRYDFSYKAPHYGLMLAALALLVIFGSWLAVADANLPGRSRIPSFVNQYSGEQLSAGRLTGLIVDINDSGFSLRLGGGQTVMVITSSQTLGLAPTGLTVGQIVTILGRWQDDNLFEARAIRYLGNLNDFEILRQNSL